VITAAPRNDFVLAAVEDTLIAAASHL